MRLIYNFISETEKLRDIDIEMHLFIMYFIGEYFLLGKLML
jgi:hypothetical protein